jgi:hypothetical protein
MSLHARHDVSKGLDAPAILSPPNHRVGTCVPLAF